VAGGELEPGRARRIAEDQIDVTDVWRHRGEAQEPTGAGLYHAALLDGAAVGGEELLIDAQALLRRLGRDGEIG
jgi:hypothetical protein